MGSFEKLGDGSIPKFMHRSAQKNPTDKLLFLLIRALSWLGQWWANRGSYGQARKRWPGIDAWSELSESMHLFVRVKIWFWWRTGSARAITIVKYMLYTGCINQPTGASPCRYCTRWDLLGGISTSAELAPKNTTMVHFGGNPGDWSSSCNSHTNLNQSQSTVLSSGNHKWQWETPSKCI